MKRFSVLLACLILVSSFSVAKEEKVDFTLKFLKRGETAVSICDLDASETTVDRNTTLTQINFSMFDETDPTATGTPSAKFGIAWDVFSGTSYTLSLSCYAEDASSLHPMAYDDDISALANPEDAYLDYQISIEGKTTASDVISEQYDTANDGLTYDFFTGSREEYSLVQGSAIVTLTLEERTSYLGDYSGSITVYLRTN